MVISPLATRGGPDEFSKSERQTQRTNSCFSEKLSFDLLKAARRFVEESPYGIQSRQSVHLSEIGKALNDKVLLIKTLNRLSLQLSRAGLWQKLSTSLLKLVAGSVKADTLLILDLSDITAHAEMMCLRDLSSRDLDFDLSNITIYSTLEPCPMCTGAMIHYKIPRVVYGEIDIVAGACGSKFKFNDKAGLKADSGVLRHECRKILLDYFESQLGHKSNRWMDIELPVI